MAEAFIHRGKIIKRAEFDNFISKLVADTIQYFEKHLIFKSLHDISPDPLYQLYDDADGDGVYATWPGYSFVTDPRNRKFYLSGFVDIFSNFETARGHYNLLTTEMQDEGVNGAPKLVKTMTKEAQANYIYCVGRWLDLLKCVMILCSGVYPEGNDLDRLVIDNEGFEGDAYGRRRGLGPTLVPGALMRNIFFKYEESQLHARGTGRVIIVATSISYAQADGSNRSLIRRRMVEGDLARAIGIYLIDVVPFLAGLKWASHYEKGNRMPGCGKPDWNDLWAGAKTYCQTSDWEHLVTEEVRLRLDVKMTIDDIGSMCNYFLGVDRFPKSWG